MSDGNNYGLSWQTPVGWLGDHVPENQKADAPLSEVAKKLAYYMGLASSSNIVESNATLETLPSGVFHRHDGARGPHNCEIGGCGMWLSGVFGFRKWKFPTGIVHYILDHNWQPPKEFLDDLAQLPAPPPVVEVPPYVAPNKAGLFHSSGRTTRG